MVSLSTRSDDINEEFHRKWETEQEELKKNLICEDTESWQDDFDSLHYVGGVDVSFVKTSTTLACASLVVCSFPDLEVVYSDCELVHLDTPYIPGFLAFREVGFFLSLLEKQRSSCRDLTPQVIFVDGNGILHPRGFGIASHLGVLSNIPCVGVAKTLMQVDGISKGEQFTAKVAELTNSGDTFPLETLSGSVLGMALKGCSQSSNPIFVSAGHRISLQTAVQLAHRCCRYRIAEPVRQADIRSREFLREKFPETVASSQQSKGRAGRSNKHPSERSHHLHANESKVAGAKSAVCFLDEDHSEQSDEELNFDCLLGPL